MKSFSSAEKTFTRHSIMESLPEPRDNVERLHRKLLYNYDKTRVPIDKDTNEAVNVSVYMWPYDILFVVSQTD